MAKAGGNLLNTYVADYVVFDLETTGISPKTDEVVEISAVKVEHGKVTDEFSTLVNPKRRIPYGASRVNGITDDMVAEAPFFEQVLEEFLEFIEGFVLVGHNIARFDMNFLYRDVEKYFERSLPNDYIDTLQMARRELPNLEHHRLTDLAEYYGISAEGAHRALNDCRMNQQVLRKWEILYTKNRAKIKKITEESIRQKQNRVNRHKTPHRQSGNAVLLNCVRWWSGSLTRIRTTAIQF